MLKKIIKKNLCIIGRGYPNASETGIRFDFSSPLDMGSVTIKYVRVGYGDGEGKTHPRLALLSCLDAKSSPLSTLECNHILI